MCNFFGLKQIRLIVAALGLAVFAPVNAGWLLPSFNVANPPAGLESGPQIAKPFSDVRLNLHAGWRMVTGPSVYTLLDIGEPRDPSSRVLIIPQNEAWVAVLSRVDSGFVPLSTASFNAAAVRRAVFSLPPSDLLGDLRKIGRIVKMHTWIDPPALDDNAKSVRFLATAIGDEAFMYGRAALFGRSGYIGIRLFGSAYSSTDDSRALMDSLLNACYFTEGNTYEDQSSGDMRAKTDPAKILIGTAAVPARMRMRVDPIRMIIFSFCSVLLMALYRWVVVRARR